MLCGCGNRVALLRWRRGEGKEGMVEKKKKRNMASA
jgi:hypothetical protein